MRVTATAVSTTVRSALGFWIVAFALLAVMALGTAPSPLYGLYQVRDGFSSFTITLIYAAYAIGATGTLVFAGHTSDWYGRRRLLFIALALAVASGLVFLVWRAVAGLLVGRILSGAAVGAMVATATAYLVELDAASRPPSSGRRPQLVALVANVGGLGLGAFVTGLLARYFRDPLAVPYVVFLVALMAAALAGAAVPETRIRPAHVRYHPQRLAVPPAARTRYFAALVGALLSFGVFGLFAGLAGALLHGSFHKPSPALAGVSVAIMFWSGVGAQAVTMTWTPRRGQLLGVALMLAGLTGLVVSVWLNSPSLALFFVGETLAGAGGGAVVRATLGTVIEISAPEHRAEALSGLFLAGYIGLSVPVVGVGIALQYASERVSVLGFAIVVAVSIVAMTPVLAQRSAGSAQV